MGLGQTAIIISLFISIAIYVGSMDTSSTNPITYNGQGTVLGNFYDNQTQQINNNVLSGLPQNPSTTGAQAQTSSGLGFVDGLLLIMNGAYSFVKLLFGVILAPISLMGVEGMPTVFKVLIAVPLQLLNILGIVALIRGVFSW